MKFPRNAKLFRSQFDAAPFAAVFFLLLLFLLTGALLYTPGVRLNLPVANDLPGTDKPTVTVAVDAAGRLYFENQLVEPKDLKAQLEAAAKKSPEPLTLVVQADKAVTYDKLIQLSLLARDAGMRDALLATLPRVIAVPQSRTPVQP